MWAMSPPTIRVLRTSGAGAAVADRHGHRTEGRRGQYAGRKGGTDQLESS